MNQQNTNMQTEKTPIDKVGEKFESVKDKISEGVERVKEKFTGTNEHSKTTFEHSPTADPRPVEAQKPLDQLNKEIHSTNVDLRHVEPPKETTQFIQHDQRPHDSFNNDIHSKDPRPVEAQRPLDQLNKEIHSTNVDLRHVEPPKETTPFIQHDQSSHGSFNDMHSKDPRPVEAQRPLDQLNKEIHSTNVDLRHVEPPKETNPVLQHKFEQQPLSKKQDLESDHLEKKKELNEEYLKKKVSLQEEHLDKKMQLVDEQTGKVEELKDADYSSREKQLKETEHLFRQNRIKEQHLKNEKRLKEDHLDREKCIKEDHLDRLKEIKDEHLDNESRIQKKHEFNQRSNDQLAKEMHERTLADDHY
jgi:hypothetical protein